MQLPTKLYKYQRYNDDTLENLRNKCLWYSKPARFNDPFDCKINFDYESTTSDNWEIVYKQFRELSKSDGTLVTPAFTDVYLAGDNPSERFLSDAPRVLGSIFEQGVHKDFRDRGIACFSELNDDILMWSHYADRHQGFCIEYDTKFYPFTHAIRVNYPSSFPPLNLSEGRKEIILDLVTTKASQWSYEKEWRIFHEEGDKTHTIDPRSITSIYFGCLMPDEHIKALSSLLTGLTINQYRAKKHKTKFKIMFESAFAEN